MDSAGRMDYVMDYVPWRGWNTWTDEDAAEGRVRRSQIKINK